MSYYHYRSKPKRKGDDALSLQRFILDEGCIVVSQHSGLVLGVKETEGRVSEVMLVKRRPDDIHQRWVLHDSGSVIFIYIIGYMYLI